jgi:hypothetical protein
MVSLPAVYDRGKLTTSSPALTRTECTLCKYSKAILSPTRDQRPRGYSSTFSVVSVSEENSSTGPSLVRGSRNDRSCYASDRLRSSLLLHHHTLDVDLRDLVVYNDELGQKVQEQPGEMIPLVSWVVMKELDQLILYSSNRHSPVWLACSSILLSKKALARRRRQRRFQMFKSRFAVG